MKKKIIELVLSEDGKTKVEKEVEYNIVDDKELEDIKKAYRAEYDKELIADLMDNKRSAADAQSEEEKKLTPLERVKKLFNRNNPKE